MPRITLKIVDSANGRTVLEKPPGDFTPYQGLWGDLIFDCGGCGHTLAERALPDRDDGIVIRCPACRALNLTATRKLELAPPPDTSSAPFRARDLRDR